MKIIFKLKDKQRFCIVDTAEKTTSSRWYDTIQLAEEDRSHSSYINWFEEYDETTSREYYLLNEIPKKFPEVTIHFRNGIRKRKNR